MTKQWRRRERVRVTGSMGIVNGISIRLLAWAPGRDTPASHHSRR